MRRGWVLLAAVALLATSCGLKVPVQTAGQLAAGGEAGAEGALDTSADQTTTAATDTGTVAGSAGSAARAAGKAAEAAKQAAQAAGGGLFANETEGLTDKSITICSHIPMTGAAPIPRDPARWGKFYFDYVNAEFGGIHGRKVNFITRDDQYYPAGALQAVEQCKAQGTFLFSGAAGTDQIVAVARSFAAANKVPYLAGPAAFKDIGGIPQVKLIGPDYEYQHVLLANYMVKNAKRLTGKDKPVFGMIRINSPYFTAGHDVFVDELRKLGYTLAVDKVVQKDENQFSDIMLEMQQRNVDIINNFTTPNIWIKLLKQNNNPAYQPLFTAVSPAAGYNLISAALADSKSKAVLFHHFNPPYNESDTSVPWYSDIQKFKQIVAKYGPKNDSAPIDDFDYSAYLASRSLYNLLNKAGKDLTRSKLWQFISTYKVDKQAEFPACGADFTRGAGVRGSWAVNVFELNGAQWKLVSPCIEQA